MSEGLAAAITYGGKFDDLPVPQARDLVGRLAAYFPDDAIVIDLARFERLLRAGEAAYEWFNAPYDAHAEGGGESWAAAEQALGSAAKALLPTDTDPLP